MYNRFSVYILLTSFFLSLQLISFSQENDPIRCGVDHWLELQMQDPDFAEKFRETENYFHEQKSGRSPSCSNPVIIPIAVHWNGNVVDVPCLEYMAELQVQVLNEDFGGYNLDIEQYCEHSLNCSDDYPLDAVTAGTCIQFCLATKNHPAGSGLSDGDPAFTFGQYTFNSGASAWAGYMNLFVADVPPSGYGSGLLGLAPLFGGNNPNGNGVWVNARAFGGQEETCQAGSVTINSMGNYDLGRTTTHELGHYFGLRHVFQGCGSGDLIDDTPPQSDPNYGIESIDADCNNSAGNTCDTIDFYFNYMDYTHDVSMYMFTSDQSDLMYSVATNGSFQSETTVCDDIPDSYDPIFPTGCYTCPDLSLDYSQLDVSCYDECDGSITIDFVDGAVEPITYEWSTGDSGTTIENLCPGDYYVTISDKYNCELFDVITISEPDELIANAYGNDESGNGFDDGIASADPDGGTQPYFYEWNNGETTQTIEGLPPGNYVVTVTDAYGCESIEAVYIEEYICPELDIQAFVFDEECYEECNGEIEIVGVENATEPFYYLWSNGSTDPMISDLCPGEFTVNITDALNCEVVSETFIVDDAPEFSGVVNSTDESAFNADDGTATAVPTGGTSPYSYEWSNGETTQTITDLEPGIYSVIITDDNDCQIEEYAYIAEYFCTEFGLEFQILDNECFGECDGLIISNIEQGIDGPFYDWSNGDTDHYLNLLCAGNYAVTVSEPFEGCEEYYEFVITEPEEITLNLNVSHESAFDAEDGEISSNVLGGTGTYEYLWSNGSTEENLTDLAPGEYSLTITDFNDCQQIETVSIEAFVCPDLLLLSSSTNLDCYEECNGTISLDALENATEPLTYIWSNGEENAQLTGLCAGEYLVTITDAYNCSFIEGFTIIQPEELLVNISATGESANDANDGTASANANGGTPPYSYVWSNGETSQNIENLTPGEYSVTVTDQNGCSSVQSIIVDDYSCTGLSLVSTTNHNPCLGDCLGSIDINGLENGMPPFSYQWSNGSAESSLEGLCAGVYTVTVSDANNCSIITSIEIEDGVDIQFTVESISNVYATQNGAIDISTNGDYEFEWTGENDFHSTDEDIVDLNPGCFDLVITDPESGCSLDTTICVKDLTATLDKMWQEVNIYPNPVDDKLWIDFGGSKSHDIELQIINISGNSLLTINKEAGQDKIQLDMDLLQSGVYIIRFQSEQKKYFRRVIVIH